MTDVPIPADVMERARETVHAYLRDARTELGAKMVIGYRSDILQDHIASALMEERERAARMCEAWTRPDALRLAAGEMTAQEMRTAQAVARGLAAAIRGNHNGS